MTANKAVVAAAEETREDKVKSLPAAIGIVVILVLILALALPNVPGGIIATRASQCGDLEAFVSPQYWRGFSGETAGPYDLAAPCWQRGRLDGRPPVTTCAAGSHDVGNGGCCPDGWHGEGTKCIKDGPPVKTCAAGSHDVGNDRCCPNGYHGTGDGTCTADVATCPAGYDHVPNTAKCCPAGHAYLGNGRCA